GASPLPGLAGVLLLRCSRRRLSLLRHSSAPFFYMLPAPPSSTLFPYTTLFRSSHAAGLRGGAPGQFADGSGLRLAGSPHPLRLRSEEHTSELQSRENLVCRLLLEKKKRSHAPSPAGPALPGPCCRRPRWMARPP